MRSFLYQLLRYLKPGLFLLPYALIFHYGWYKYLTVPRSLTHDMETAIFTMSGHVEGKIVVLGDSTARFGFLFDTYNRYSQQQVINLGMAGAGYLPVHKLGKDFGRPDRAALVIFCGDQFRDKDDRRILRDQEYLKTRLAFTDIPALWYYSPSLPVFFSSLSNLSFRAILFRRDLQDLILHPDIRWQALRDNREYFHQTVEPYSPLGENQWTLDITGLDDPRNIPAQLRTGSIPAGQQRVRLEETWKTYQARLLTKDFDSQADIKMQRLLSTLSSSFRHVFITPAPFFQGYRILFPEKYQLRMEQTMASAASHFPNVTFIPKNRDIDSRSRFFQDAIHTNRQGAAALTLHTSRYLERYANLPVSPLLARALQEIAQ